MDENSTDTSEVSTPLENNTPVVPDAPAVPDTPDAPLSKTWDDDWRNSYASGDEKKLKKLERFSSPKAALDSLFNLQAKLSSGEYKVPLKEGATPEEVDEWRSINGIPKTAAEYDLTLPNGYQIGEADKPLVDDFLKAAHEGNFKTEEVKQALNWYFNKQQDVQAYQEQRDAETREAAEAALRDEWGPDFKKNTKLAFSILESGPPEVKDRLLNGRLKDGTLIGNDPDILRWLSDLSREVNPVGTVVPGSGTNAVQAVESEISSLKAMMGDRKSAYWKGDQADKMQARFRELTDALNKRR